MKLDYQPDAVVITLSKEMMMERGYKNWLHEITGLTIPEKIDCKTLKSK